MLEQMTCLWKKFIPDKRNDFFNQPVSSTGIYSFNINYVYVIISNDRIDRKYGR